MLCCNYNILRGCPRPFVLSCVVYAHCCCKCIQTRSHLDPCRLMVDILMIFSLFVVVLEETVSCRREIYCEIVENLYCGQSMVEQPPYYPVTVIRYSVYSSCYAKFHQFWWNVSVVCVPYFVRHGSLRSCIFVRTHTIWHPFHAQ